MALAMFLDTAIMDSPYVVPVAGCIMILGIVAVGNWANVRNQEMKNQERLAAIARGVPLPPTAAELAIAQGKPTVDASKRYANVRLAGIILLCGGVGLILTCIALALILQVRAVLCGAAAGLIPLGLGAGFLIDARHQARDMALTSNPPSV